MGQSPVALAWARESVAHRTGARHRRIRGAAGLFSFRKPASTNSIRLGYFAEMVRGDTTTPPPPLCPHAWCRANAPIVLREPQPVRPRTWVNISVRSTRLPFAQRVTSSCALAGKYSGHFLSDRDHDPRLRPTRDRRTNRVCGEMAAKCVCARRDRGKRPSEVD